MSPGPAQREPPARDEPAATDRALQPGAARVRRRKPGSPTGWYATFICLAIVACLAVGYVTGIDALAATARFAWNALAAISNAAFRATGQLLGLLAKGVGWRRLTRFSHVVGSVGLSYSGSVVLSERRLRQAQGWTGKLKRAVAAARMRWLALHLTWKLAIVVALIASQVYLHSLFIVFPIAFLVPVVRRIWVQTADLVFGSWYWRTFGPTHRALASHLRRVPVVRQMVGATRVARIRYLYAWRLWRYDPRYRDAQTSKRRLSLAEPLRLWRKGQLDGYIGRPLLKSRRTPLPSAPAFNAGAAAGPPNSTPPDFVSAPRPDQTAPPFTLGQR